MAQNTPAYDTGGFGMPLEYQSQLESLQKRRQLAQHLLQQSLTPQQSTMMGPIAVRHSPLVNIARVLSAGLGGWMDKNAGKEAAALQQKAQSEGQTEMQRLLGMEDPRARASAAMASPFSGIRQQGQQWQKDWQENVRAASKIAGDAGDARGGVDMLRTGQLGDYTPPEIPKPEFGTYEDSPYAVTYDRRRQPKVTSLGIPKTTVTVNPDSKAATEFLTSQLTKRQVKAQTAVDVLRGVQDAVGALSRGADAGGGGEVIQFFRKALQMFGQDLPENASTNELQMALGKAMLGRLSDLRPASDKDIEELKRIVGNINTDPTALARSLALGHAIAMKDLQDFNRYVDTQATSKDERAETIFRGANVGFEMPHQLRGPENWIVNMLQQMQALGGDTTPWAQMDIQGGDVDPTIRALAKAIQVGPGQPPAGVDIRPPRRR